MKIMGKPKLTILEALREQQRNGVEHAGMSENSRRNLDNHIKVWQTWADENGVQDVPAAPESIRDFLYREAERGRTLGTLRVRLWAIGVLHKGQDDPTKNELVTATIKGIGQIIGDSQEQAAPLDTEALEAIERTACNRRSGSDGRGESTAIAERRGIMDIAICYLLSDCGLRRSEAAALTWADVDGQHVHIRKSKTDQTGTGTVVSLTPKGYKALLRYRDSITPPGMDLPDTAKMFNITARSISNRVKAAAKAAGLEGNYSGHSGRVGLAHRAARSEFSTSMTMVSGRWSRSETVARYQRKLDSTELANQLQ